MVSTMIIQNLNRKIKANHLKWVPFLPGAGVPFKNLIALKAIINQLFYFIDQNILAGDRSGLLNWIGLNCIVLF